MTTSSAPLAHKILDGEFGGDGLEQAVWPSLNGHFPHYEVLWSELIWGLTNRVYMGRVPQLDVHHFRSDLMDRQPMLIWFAQAHYSVFKGLASIWFRVHHWTAPTPAEASPVGTLNNLLHLDRLNDVYRLIGSVDDLVGVMAHTIERLEQAASGAPAPIQKTQDELREKLDKWYSGQYGKLFERFSRELRPVSLPIHHRGDGLRRMLPADLAERYSSFRDRAAQYRNLLHSPQPAQMWRDNEHWVPKPEHLSEYAHWPKMAGVTDDELQAKFQPAQKAMERDAAELIRLLDEIWEAVLGRLRALMATPIFQQWMEHDTQSLQDASPLIYARQLTEAATTSAYFPPVGLSGVKASEATSIGGWNSIPRGPFSEEKGKS